MKWIMSEDSDLTFLESVLENVGFNMDVLDCVSYDCRSNLYSTLQSCKTTLKFKPNINTVIFHRDSDFMMMKTGKTKNPISGKRIFIF